MKITINPDKEQERLLKLLTNRSVGALLRHLLNGNNLCVSWLAEKFQMDCSNMSRIILQLEKHSLAEAKSEKGHHGTRKVVSLSLKGQELAMIIDELEEFAAILNSETRRKILVFLIERSATGKELAARLEQTRSNIYYHGDILSRKGLIKRKKRGHEKILTITPKGAAMQ